LKGFFGIPVKLSSPNKLNNIFGHLYICVTVLACFTWGTYWLLLHVTYTIKVILAELKKKTFYRRWVRPLESYSVLGLWKFIAKISGCHLAYQAVKGAFLWTETIRMWQKYVYICFWKDELFLKTSKIKCGPVNIIVKFWD
jgi:hypothetical protein